MPLRQRHEQISRPDDFIDARNSLDAVRQRGHRLCSTDAVDFANSDFVTDRQQIGVVTAEFGRRDDDRDFLHTRGLCRDSGHQHRRGVRRRSPRNADSDPFQRQIPLPQLDDGLPSFRTMLASPAKTARWNSMMFSRIRRTASSNPASAFA